MTSTLFIGNKRYSSWSMRPWVLMKALNIPFTEELHVFAAGVRQPAFKTFSPSGKVPTLHHGDAVIWDSLAIVEYLAEDHPLVWPSDRKARAWARCAAAEMHSGFPAIRDQCSMNVALRIELGAPDAELQRDLDRVDHLWTEGLSRFGGPWLAGEGFSAVDAFFAPVASRLLTYGVELSSAPAREYARRLLEHPAVAQWIEEGIKETAREPMHEEDCVRGRKVVKDISVSS